MLGIWIDQIKQPKNKLAKADDSSKVNGSRIPISFECGVC